MGLSFHYNGKFNKKAVLSELISEVKDIVEAFHWEYTIFEESFPNEANANDCYNDEVYGISFTPPKCETVSICFLSNYRMSSPVLLHFWGNSTDESERDLLYMLSIKTQFASTSIHKTIIQLFRYLCDRNYFEEFNMIDEGEYWESGDEKLLEKKFKENGYLIDSFALAVESSPAKKGETFENYFERIIKMIDDRRKKTD